MPPMKRILFLLFFGLTAPASWAGGPTAPVGPPADKSQYNLFHPTPEHLLRGFSADRPSQSTGPYTVDAGHYYFEASAAAYLYDRSGGATTRQWNVLPFNVRIGLTNNVELDLAYASYLHVRTRGDATGQTSRRSGFGDLIVQGKIALYGNDRGPVAFGVIPFLKFPTSTAGLGHDSIEGGISVPFQAALPGGFGLGLQTGINFARTSADDGYEPNYVNAVIVSHALFADQWSIYGEFYSVLSGPGASTHAAFFDTGLVYQVAPNASLDLGCNFGLTDAAPDYQPFAGFSLRF